jgi:hypothetical protein
VGKKIQKVFLIPGQNGAGKDFVEELLKSFSNNVYCVHMREEIPLIAQNEKVIFSDREDFIKYTTKKRKKYGAGYFVKKSLENLPEISWVIVNSMRHPDEYKEAFQYAEQVIIVAVLACSLTASPDQRLKADIVRFNRLTKRGTVTDKFKSFDDFLAKDKKEWRPKNPHDPNAHNVEACVQMAIEGKGFVVLNGTDDEDSVDQIKAQIRRGLSSFDLLPTGIS